MSTQNSESKNSKSNALVVAITGGIGCGQSTVANIFKKCGAYIIDADVLGKRVVDENADVRKELRAELGKQYFYRNGRLNRSKLGEAVFTDERKLLILNHIVHPRLVELLIDEIETARDKGVYAVVAVDAALVFEVRMESMFDAVIVVSANTRNRIDRVKERDKMDEKEIRDRIKRQIPIRDKARWADFVIHNNSSLQKLEHHSRKVYKILLRKRKN